MPKKANPESQKEQSERFVSDARRMMGAGELNPIDAEKGLEGLVRRAKADGR